MRYEKACVGDFIAGIVVQHSLWAGLCGMYQGGSRNGRQERKRVEWRDCLSCIFAACFYGHPGLHLVATQQDATGKVIIIAPPLNSSHEEISFTRLRGCIAGPVCFFVPDEHTERGRK